MSIGGICKVYSKPIIGLLLSLLGFSFYETKETREYYSKIEQECRFCGVNEVLDFMKEKEAKDSIVLVCDNILLYQNICSDDFRICDSRDVETLTMDDKYKYFFIASDLNYLRKRYGININMMKLEKQHTLNNGDIIYKMN